MLMVLASPDLVMALRAGTSVMPQAIPITGVGTLPPA